MKLPKEKTEPQVDLSDQTILIHGNAKIGKSEFCCNAPESLFLATEAGLNHLTAFQIPIGTWDDLLEACAEISLGEHNFQTIVLDTVDNAFLMCSEYICKLHGIKHPSDLGYGKGFALINNEFYRVLNKLSLMPYGLFLISHTQEKEVETRTGKIIKFVPSLSDKVGRMVTGMCDFVLYFDSEDEVQDKDNIIERRIIRTKPSQRIVAGDRTGNLPDTIDMEYRKFLAAYKIAVSKSLKQNGRTDKSQTKTTNQRSNTK
ncbi:ATP-binding protein [bacterium]|nr:ATP-binding protein [bacterium]